MWTKYVTRRLAVQIAQAWNFGFGRAMQEVYDTSISNTLVFRDQKKTDYYLNYKEFETYTKNLYKLLEKPDFIKSFHKEAKEVLENILDKVREECTKDLSKFSNKKLLNLYTDVILPNQTQFYVRMWTVFNIGEPLANVVSKKLQENLEEKKANEFLLALSSPLVPNDVLNERISLLKIACAQKGGKYDESQLTKHYEQFKHIPMFDFDHEPYNFEHFKNELQNISNPEIELKHLEEQFLEKKNDFDKTIQKLKPDTLFKNLLIFLKENVFLRDYRDMIRQKLNIVLRDFYGEVAKRLDLSIPQVATLTNDEIKECLKNEVAFPKEEITKREKAFLLIQRGGKAKIYSGEEAVEKSKKELGEETIGNTKTITGVTGAKGKAKGKVRLVFTNKDLNKVEEGDILVATMTRQDFVTAIRKAVALVTDEGSVTAHAAIIARELNIPCVVATKIATKVLKDGDLVEVDADKGIITIL